MMKFEIINPSDKAFLESDDFKTACISSILVTAHHGLKQVDGELEMPPFLFGGVDEWWNDKFNESFETSLKNIDKKEIVKVLKSFQLNGERTSLRDFVKYAHELADRIKVN